MPLWPFPVKSDSQLRRVDQGLDLQFPGIVPVPVLAVATGQVSMGGPDPNGFGPGYPILTLSKPAPGGPAVYYGHTFINKALIGSHVPVGTPIGMTGGKHSGGNAYADSNWLEIGFWNNGPVGNGADMKAWLSGATGGDIKNGWYVITRPPLSQRLGGGPIVGVSQKPIPPGATIISGPYATKAEAVAAGGAKAGNPLGGLSGLDSIGHFFSNLTQREFWIRVAEFGIGAGLIWIAVGRLASDTKAGKAVMAATPGLFPGGAAVKAGAAAKGAASKAASAVKPAPKPTVKPVKP